MDESGRRMLTSLSRPGGAVAQLGARLDGIEEVVGSNPIGSTKNFNVFLSLYSAKPDYRQILRVVKINPYGKVDFSGRGRLRDGIEISRGGRRQAAAGRLRNISGAAGVDAAKLSTIIRRPHEY